MLTQEACTRDGVSDDVRMRAVSVIMHASSADEARVLLVKAKIAEEALQVLSLLALLSLCCRCCMRASSADEARVLLVEAKIAEEALQVLLWRQYLYFCTSKQVLLYQYA